MFKIRYKMRDIYLFFEYFSRSIVQFKHTGILHCKMCKLSLFSAMAPPRETGEIEKHLSDAIPVLDEGLRKVKANQVYYLVAMMLCLFTTIFTSNMTLPFGLTLFITLLRVVMVVAVAFFFWTATVLANKEINGLTAARKDINNALKSNPVI